MTESESTRPFCPILPAASALSLTGRDSPRLASLRSRTAAVQMNWKLLITLFKHASLFFTALSLEGDVWTIMGLIHMVNLLLLVLQFLPMDINMLLPDAIGYTVNR